MDFVYLLIRTITMEKHFQPKQRPASSSDFAAWALINKKTHTLYIILSLFSHASFAYYRPVSRKIVGHGAEIKGQLLLGCEPTACMWGGQKWCVCVCVPPLSFPPCQSSPNKCFDSNSVLCVVVCTCVFVVCLLTCVNPFTERPSTPANRSAHTYTDKQITWNMVTRVPQYKQTQKMSRGDVWLPRSGQLSPRWCF